MSEPFFSASWHRVARLRPTLRSHVRFERHLYRGERWYVLRDATSQTVHRLSSVAVRIVGLMDGERSVQQIWESVAEALGDEAPTQDEVIGLLSLLYSADALSVHVTPDLAKAFEARRRREGREWWQRLATPLSFRLPLGDPDRLLTRLEPLAGPLFTRAAAGVWCATVFVAALLAWAHADALADGAADKLLALHNLALLAVLYPLLKAVHELGHGLAAKTWGCEVHEAGLMFIVFLPMPYVDASAAAALADKRRRIVVSAAGIAVEAFLASLALFVWLSVDPGWVRAVAFDVMVIAGLSTLAFNGNPLLKFDGYFVFADAIEIPNLAERSTQYLRYGIERAAFRLSHSRYPVMTPSERPWLLVYGVASAIYRVFIALAIALFVAGKFFVVGVALALASVALQFVWPLVRGFSEMLTHPRYGAQRGRALALSLGSGAVLALLLSAVPVPMTTNAQGVVWPPEDAQVRAGTEGFVLSVAVEPGAMVAAGDPLLVTRDPLLEARVARLEGRLRELRARRHAEEREDLVRAQITDEELETAAAELARAREDLGEVTIRSPSDGRFMPAEGRDLTGRFVRRGERVAYVLGARSTTVRVVLLEEDVALVREGTRGVRLRRSHPFAPTETARVVRQVPAASDRLPSRALGSTGGGRWPVDPGDDEGVRSLRPVFQFDLEVRGRGFAFVGERVDVRFDHPAEPLAPRLARGLRRLFLGRLRV